MDIEAELGSDNEYNDGVIKNIKDDDNLFDDEDLNKDLDGLIDNEEIKDEELG